ncbi:MAG: alpha-amylase family glycosyl hydrolase [Promethearchaeota archaeon]
MINKQSNFSIPWWKKAVFYQIYPRSFKDTSDNGIGDLNGIISKLDYLKELGIGGIWLCPVYPSPQKDFGYGISDFRNVDKLFGNMDILDHLIDEVHKRDMKIVLDITLNHTSDEHPWFKESRSSRENPKRDWYLWRKGRIKKFGKKMKQKPPNNWRSVTFGSGWHYDKMTDEWYFGRYFSFHPELNFRNPEVQREMLDIIKFWFDKGIDGFRLDVIDNLFVDEKFRDNPFTFKIFSPETGEFLFRSSKMIINLPETIQFMRVLRDIADEYKNKGHDKLFVGEATTTDLKILQKYCGKYFYDKNGRKILKNDGLHLIFLFDTLNLPMKASKFRKLLENYEKYFPEPLTPTLVFGNHDRMRRISKIGNSILKAKLNLAFQMTARGVPFIYYGEEIGIEQARIPLKEALDPIVDRFRKIPQIIFDIGKKIFKESLNRDECRTPMQWTAGVNAGFCEPHIKPWLPIPPSYKERNVKSEENDPKSLLSCYKRFIHARNNTPALNSGSLMYDPKEIRKFFIEKDLDSINIKKIIPDSVLFYIRYDSNQIALIFLNFKSKKIKFKNPTPNARFLASTSRTSIDYEIFKKVITMDPYEGLILLID